MTHEQLAHLTSSEREAWEAATHCFDPANEGIPQPELRDYLIASLRSMAEFRAAVDEAPHGDTCLTVTCPNVATYTCNCWKSRIK